MKITILLVAVLVVCLVSPSDAGWGRFVRRVRRAVRRVVDVVKKTCPVICPRVCSNGVCAVVCSEVCKRLKRDAIKTAQGHVTPLANQFSAYDMNNDGVLNITELAMAIGEKATDTDLQVAFNLADTDKNQELTPQEFYNGPFVFEMDLNDDDLQYCRYRLDVDNDLQDLIDEDDSDGIEDSEHGGHRPQNPPAE